MEENSNANARKKLGEMAQVLWPEMENFFERSAHAFVTVKSEIVGYRKIVGKFRVSQPKKWKCFAYSA